MLSTNFDHGVAKTILFYFSCVDTFVFVLHQFIICEIVILYYLIGVSILKLDFTVPQ